MKYNKTLTYVNSPIHHSKQENMECYGSYCQLLPVLDEGGIVRIAVPPASVKSVQVVVPHQRDGGKKDSRQWKVAQRQAEQHVQVLVAIEIGHPGKYKNLKNVENDGDEPGEHSPA